MKLDEIENLLCACLHIFLSVLEGVAGFEQENMFTFYLALNDWIYAIVSIIIHNFWTDILKT